jgi:hypothetical protein
MPQIRNTAKMRCSKTWMSQKMTRYAISSAESLDGAHSFEGRAFATFFVRLYKFAARIIYVFLRMRLDRSQQSLYLYRLPLSASRRWNAAFIQPICERA